jgi:hypothetical protein
MRRGLAKREAEPYDVADEWPVTSWDQIINWWESGRSRISQFGQRQTSRVVFQIFLKPDILLRSSRFDLQPPVAK